MRGSPWRSPLLILGIAVILAAAAALVAPYFINWNGWRGDIERFAERLTGREVRIEGDIDAVLFPWPRLTLGAVTVASAEGASEPYLLEVPRIDIALALPPLLSGEYEMTEVRLSQPRIALERLAEGDWNAALTPDPAIAGRLDPARVSFPRIVVDGGTLTLVEQAGNHRLTLPIVEATGSAPALTGPWKTTTRLVVGEVPRVLAVNTGAWRASDPLRLYMTLTPEPGVAGYAVSFDGVFPQEDEGPPKGVLRLQPVTLPDGREDPQFGFQRMMMKADVEFANDRIVLPKIEIAPAANDDAGNIIAGTGSIGVGERIAIAARLASPRLDLDRLIGQEKRQTVTSAGAIGILTDAASRLPSSVDADVRLEVSTVEAGGETLDGAVVDVRAGREGVALNEFALSLPGQTRLVLRGKVSGAAPNAALSGEVELSSRFLRDFVGWMSPDTLEAAGAAWSGARGDLALKGPIEAGSGRISLEKAAVTLDETKGTLSLDYHMRPRPTLDLAVDADAVDPARYAPAAGSFSAAEAAHGIARWSASAAGLDLATTARIGALTLNGETARNAAIDIRVNEGRVDLRALELADVGGGRLSARGRMENEAAGPKGQMTMEVSADDPRTLARFLGVAGGNETGATPWQAGPLRLSIDATAETATEGTAISGSGRGSLGPATASLQGEFRGALESWRDGAIDVKAEGSSASSAAVAALLGLATPRSGEQPAEMKLTVAGTPAKGLATALDVEAFGAAVQFQGDVTAAPDWRAIGRTAVLAPDASPMLTVLGLAPPAGPAGRFLSGEAHIDATLERLAIKTLTATVAGTTVTGDLAVTLEDRAALEGTLKAGTVDLAPLLTALVPAAAPGALDRPFERLPARPLKLDVRADDLGLLPSVRLANGTLSLASNPEGVRVAVAGRDETGRDASLTLSAKPADQGLTVSVDSTLGFDLGTHLRQADGSAALSGTAATTLSAQGSGLSPASVLSALEGNGTVALKGLRLAGVDPGGFVGGLAVAQTAPDVEALVDTTLKAGSIAIADATAAVTVDGGIAASAPVPVALDGVTGSLRLVLDLASARADISADLTLSERGRTWPSFELAWAGAPEALSAAYDVEALKSAITVDVLKRGVDQLEALQREQQRIVEEERAFARQQAIPFTEESVRRYFRARAAEDKAARDAIETRRQTEATRMRRAEQEARRAEEQRRAAEEARRKAEEERKALERQQLQTVPPGNADGAPAPLPFEQPAPASPPVPRAKPAAQPPTEPIGTPSVIPPIPGEAEVPVDVAPVPVLPVEPVPQGANSAGQPLFSRERR